VEPVFNAYAAYYDCLYQDKDYKSEIDYLHSVLIEYSVFDGQILDLGCGTGKHAQYLATLGYKVIGCDLSEEMVQRANIELPDRLKHLVTFNVGDVRTFRLGGKCDAVISQFHVASYQILNEDIQSMINTAANHLNSNGIFIFDFCILKLTIGQFE